MKTFLILLALLGTVYIPPVSGSPDWVILEITAKTSQGAVEGLPVTLWIDGYEYSGITDHNGNITIALKGHCK
jgi:hypothetical protein